ncbi:hypothetical protein, partial [Chelatococcus sp.]|uniref:hypothetical protein n=1 Tax=Chelatococcus sp. TaxID=1953771 RepID=UPI0025BC843E
GTRDVDRVREPMARLGSTLSSCAARGNLAIEVLTPLYIVVVGNGLESLRSVRHCTVGREV